MKIKLVFSAILLYFFAISANAQNTIPPGYSKGTILLSNGEIRQGYIKDNIKKSASVVYVDNAGKSKKVYDGSEINSISTDSANFICISNDFFKIICTGRLNFLQKSNNSSTKIQYNGTEAILTRGTEGKMGDYFIYKDAELKLLNRENIESFINRELTGCDEAIQKAKSINGDIAKLEGAVDTYNTYNKK